VEFRVFGRLEVVDRDRPVELGGRRQRALLACLLVHANEVVPAERLVEELWTSGSASGNALQGGGVAAAPGAGDGRPSPHPSAVALDVSDAALQPIVRARIRLR
jgi:hypothetical protein